MKTWSKINLFRKPKKKYKYRVYVIELDDPMTVYVGQSYLTPEERFQKHVSGLKSSRYVKKAKNPKLRPDLYKHLPVFHKREDALQMEAKHARVLSKMGFNVYGGH